MDGAEGREDRSVAEVERGLRETVRAGKKTGENCDEGRRGGAGF